MPILCAGKLVLPARAPQNAPSITRCARRNAMDGVKLIAPAERKFEQIGGESGDIRVGRDVAGDISTTMGAGVAVFENCSMEWTVLYDEYFYCLEGTLTIRTKQGPVVMRPGHGLLLPKGTWV